jgi:hypothetical protein
MLIVPARKFRRARREAEQPPVISAPPLMLVSSYYDDTVLEVYMTFDRNIDASGYVPGAFVLVDGNINNQTYVGNEYEVVLGGTTLRIELTATGSASGPDVELSVSSENGIVAADDRAAWAGVSGLVLPFNE